LLALPRGRGEAEKRIRGESGKTLKRVSEGIVRQKKNNHHRDTERCRTKKGREHKILFLLVFSAFSAPLW